MKIASILFWYYSGVLTFSLLMRQRKDKHLTIRTVQKIFENACKKTGVTKEVTVHSYGVNIRLDLEHV